MKLKKIHIDKTKKLNKNPKLAIPNRSKLQTLIFTEIIIRKKGDDDDDDGIS